MLFRHGADNGIRTRVFLLGRQVPLPLGYIGIYGAAGSAAFEGGFYMEPGDGKIPVTLRWLHPAHHLHFCI